MPKVPFYDQPTVEQQAVPGARLGVQASPEAFGAGAQRGADALAGAAAHAIDDERQKADEVRLLDLHRQLGDWENRTLYDPKTGAFQKRGKDAFDLPVQVTDDYDAFAGKLAEGMTNERQRLAARQIIDGRRTDIERSVQNHVAGEVRSYENETFQGLMGVSRDAALANYADPDRVAKEAETQRAAVQGFAQRNGLPSEWVDLTAGKAVSETYAGAIGRMLDVGDDLAAKAAYERWKPNLSGADGARIDTALKETSSRAESRRQADDIVLKAPDLQAALGVLESRGIKDTNVYDQTKTRLVAHYQLARAADDEHQSDVFNQATLAIDQSQEPGSPDAVPAALQTQLTNPKYKRELMAYQAAKAKGVPIQTDWGVWTQLRTLASSPATRQDFLTTNLIQARSRLSDEDYRSLVNLQAEMRAGGEKADATLVEWSLVDRVANNALRLKGINPSMSEDNADMPRASAFRKQLDDALAAEAQVVKRKLNYDEITKVSDRLLIDTTLSTPGRLWGTNTRTVPTFEAPGAAQVVHTVEQVPAAERQRIIDGLRIGMAAGQAPAVGPYADLAHYGQNVPDGRVAPPPIDADSITPQMIIDAYNRRVVSGSADGR